ncbi:MAG TPA: hypothetical protein VFK01_13205 [Bradyrhizobium sp.]|nr:hypothetical protein [Bradyrhizobium sp.]
METGGKDVSGLFIKRGMAQAFRSPQGNFGRRPADVLVREPSIGPLPDRRSGLTFSGIGSENMGLTFIYRKRAVDDLTFPCGAPDSRLAVGGRLIDAGRFDKTQARRAEPQ